MIKYCVCFIFREEHKSAHFGLAMEPFSKTKCPATVYSDKGKGCCCIC